MRIVSFEDVQPNGRTRSLSETLEECDQISSEHVFDVLIRRRSSAAQPTARTTLEAHHRERERLVHDAVCLADRLDTRRDPVAHRLPDSRAEGQANVLADDVGQPERLHLEVNLEGDAGVPAEHLEHVVEERERRREPRLATCSELHADRDNGLARLATDAVGIVAEPDDLRAVKPSRCHPTKPPSADTSRPAGTSMSNAIS